MKIRHIQINGILGTQKQKCCFFYIIIGETYVPNPDTEWEILNNTCMLFFIPQSDFDRLYDFLKELYPTKIYKEIEFSKKQS